MKKRVKLDSAAIAAVAYDFDGKTLDLKFREGSNYRYFSVPPFLFEALLEAESAGAFWNSVKNNYRYQRLA
ncbi:MAG TPA: KTSC domain-containing protein [Chthoniobacterales bacterium]|jgi:hypothetical protein